LHFWYRDSPTVMVPSIDTDRPTLDDPPIVVSGMTSLTMDLEGRLIRLIVVPPQVETRAPAAAGSAIDWKPLFGAAGLPTGAPHPTPAPRAPLPHARYPPPP